MMIAAQKLGAAARFVQGRPAKFAAPNDQRVIEQAALFEVLDQRGGGWAVFPTFCDSRLTMSFRLLTP